MMKHIWPYVNKLKDRRLIVINVMCIPLKEFHESLTICRIILWFVCKQDLNGSWKILTF